MATLNETVTIASAGNVSGSRASSLGEVVTLTAVGTVTKAGSGSALPETVDIQAQGYAIHPGASTLGSVATVSATGSVVSMNPDAAIIVVASIIAGGDTTTVPQFLFRTPSRTVHNPTGDSLFGKTSLEVGITVYHTVDGGYSQTSDPTPELLETCDEVYLGGHDTIVDQDTADRLTAAGYGPYLVQVVEGGES
jgi:hypothetical protein